MLRLPSLATIVASLLLFQAQPIHSLGDNAASSSEPIPPSVKVARSRAPQIFNAVHSSMRQWGSSLQHNGMSFFLATVPEGVLLHHGNSNRSSPTGPEWLAFEIEHAENFARGWMGGPPRRGGGGAPGGGPGDGNGPPPFRKRDEEQEVLAEWQDHSEEEDQHGWLHVYRTTRDLQFLYVDGMGAGKTSMGTLDSQDYVLRGLNGSEIRRANAKDEGDDEKKPPNGGPARGGPARGGPMDERARAMELCELCDEWGLQGVIRMEAGFEIIKCDFSDGMEEVQVLQRRDPSDGEGRGRPPGSQSLRHLEYIRGLAERYDGIGSSRAKVDYSSMVSAFFFDVNLTNPDAKRQDLPRLVSATEEGLEGIRSYLERVVEGRRNDPARTIDWQDVTDIVVARYSERIEFMAEVVESVHILEQEIDFLLDVFVDYSDKEPDLAGARERCTDFYLGAITPVTKSDWLVYAAIRSVTGRLCRDLFEVRSVIASRKKSSDSAVLFQSKEILTEVMNFLSWTRFKRCPSCGVDEVCLVPMWPFGTVEDYQRPGCSNGSQAEGSESYWGGFRGGPPGNGKEDPRPPRRV
ncbi:uncharacterized protein MKZ38_004280 [Zalerion maritima]|uniref:Uncharacterized protein n=1 Tax=Zalerion maritima TaxID=339359 RepID=A0AAD5RMF8_9PEZI|nr:uncharacterized protein MKZ38_004280 [Zalerion maritima]